jgi:serine/threonine protein phosphatase PrpC
MEVSTALRAAGDSHPGLQRPINEDRFHYDPARGLFIVVDGVGGQAAGEKAAETALAMLRARLERETGEIEDRVREAIAGANNEVHRLASLRAEWQGMACVLTIAVVANGGVVVGHVGDTRLYKLRGGRIDKLTHDHSPVGEREDAGELSEADAMQHPRRNEVYRDVGSERHEPDDPQFIDIVHVPFEPDAALLLCSDGLTDSVPAAAIQAIVQDYAGHPYEIVRSLIGAANDAGGKDNVTVVYAEGPRFTQGEETRDLRARRPAAAPVPPARMTAMTAREAVAAESAVPSDVRHGSSRGVVWALVVSLVTVAALALYWQRDRLVVPPVVPGPGMAVTARIVVRAGESIAEALARATAGTEVVVEPGEYRERLRLKDGVHVVSRVPRAASIRLPGGASETDAAVVAFDVTGATLSGFRIIGDAATPLGTGVIVRSPDLALSDVEISGAREAAIEYAGGSGGSVVAGFLHDNPGAAIVVRTGASPRIAHNQFARNATSERAPGTLVIEPGAHPVLTANTFQGVRPESILPPGSRGMTPVERDNWFTNPPQRTGTPASGPRGRGRR